AAKPAGIRHRFPVLGFGVPLAVVSLRAAAVRREPECPPLLRGRGFAWRLVSTTARPADRLAILRAHRPVEAKSVNAGEGAGAASRGCSDARGGNSQPLARPSCSFPGLWLVASSR